MTRYLRERTLYEPLIHQPPVAELGVVVVIPAKDEEDSLIQTLESLQACDPPESAVEIIVVANTAEDDSTDRRSRNVKMADAAEEWAARRRDPDNRHRVHVLRCQDLPIKHAGVGLARKIGMDEACRRLESVKNSRGVIACFDADSSCASNYLVAIEKLFRSQAGCQACSIYFEHPISGDEFDREIYEAIILYELHLRYFVQAQRYAGFPFATQSVGSSMAVRCDAYQAQNGMNRRKAGEDFYFLHKYTPLGGVVELNTTCVMPSPRKSHRVPFGTGKAVGEILDSRNGYQTYSPRSFVDLKMFFATIDDLFDLQHAQRNAYLASIPGSVADYLAGISFWSRFEEIRSNVTTLEAFRIRFFRWFNAFLIMKFVHFARDRYYPNEDVVQAAEWLLLEQSGFKGKAADSKPQSAKSLLEEFRKLDRESLYEACS